MNGTDTLISSTPGGSDIERKKRQIKGQLDIIGAALRYYALTEEILRTRELPLQRGNVKGATGGPRHIRTALFRS